METTDENTSFTNTKMALHGATVRADTRHVLFIPLSGPQVQFQRKKGLLGELRSPFSDKLPQVN